MKKLFYPAIALMNRLSYIKKFMMLWLVYLVAITVVMYGLYENLSQIGRSSQRELEGIAIMEPFFQTEHLIQQHRVLSLGLYADNINLRAERAAELIEATAAFDEIKRQLPPSLLLDEDWKQIETKWNRLQANGPELTAEENFNAHTSVINDLLEFVRDISDEYALTIDPDLNVFYMIDVSTRRLPKVLERFGQIRAYGAAVLSGKKLSEQQKVTLISLVAQLDLSQKSLIVNIKKTARLNPDLEPQLSELTKDINDSSHGIIDLVRSDIITGNFSTPSNWFIKITTDIIDRNQLRMSHILFPATEALINARIERANNKLRLTIGIACLLLLIAYYFFIGSYYSMERSVKSLARSAGAFASGHLQERINLNTRDEMNEVAGSFNKMADGFQALLATHVEDEERLRAITDNAQAVIFMKGLSGQYLHINRRFEELFHINNASIFGKTDDDVFGQKMANVFRQNDQDLIQTGQACEMEVMLPQDDGIHTYILVKFPLWKASGEMYAYCGIANDITERKRVEIELRVAATAFASHEAMVITDADTVILQINPAFTSLTGFTEEEAVGQKISILKSGRHDAAFYAAMWETINKTGTWQGEIWDRRKTGEIYPKWLTITAVKDAEGAVTRYVSTQTDISERKAAEEQIRQLAFYDPLTGLPNRRLLHERLKHGINMERRDGKQLALLMMDLDRFKAVNDNLGHLAGDELLQQVAGRITARLRDVDMVARLGGDEFVVLLEDLPQPEDAARVAEDLIADLSKPFCLAQSDNVQIGASIGISLYPQHGASPEKLMDNADTALYQAKDAGRGCFAYFSNGLTFAAKERMALETRLRSAIGQNELRVFYQPQIDIASGCIIGAEALVRWEDPLEEGLILPLRFIPIAEETGLIIEIGSWVLHETCRQGRQWLDAGLPALMLAVNVSPRQFRRSDICALVATALDDAGFPPEQLEIEITESGLMENQGNATAILNNLRIQGVHLAIDDFGTGYSSLGYLKNFPLDILKIDKSFIDDTSDMEIAATIIAMGHILGYKVLAEGVETPAQLAFLLDKGCDMYQGYIKSKPIPAKEFEALLRRQQLDMA